MPTEQVDPIASMQMETTSEREQLPPPWFAELAVVARWFHSRWVLIPLCAALRLSRRVDATAAIDVILLLLAALVGDGSLAETDEALRPVRHLLPQLWDRDRMASRSATSRFLSSLDETAMEAMQTLFCPSSACSVCGTRRPGD